LRIHEIFVPEYKVKSMNFRNQCGLGRPLHYPSIRWEKQSLRDENAKLELLTKLVEKGLVPESMLIQMLNIDPMVAREKVEQEAEAKAMRKWAMLKRVKEKGIPMTADFAKILGFAGESGDPAGMSGGGGLPASIDSGGGGSPSPAVQLPEVVPGADMGDEGATGGIDKPGDIQGAPAESNAAASSVSLPSAPPTT